MQTEPEPCAVAEAIERKRVLLVDDHQLVREGLRLMIDGTPDLCVCADVSDAALARQIVSRLKPDVAVVDLSLRRSDDDGLALVKWICANEPKTKTVVSSMHEERVYGERALRAGASGYVSKSTSGRTVLDAIRRACNGQLFFSQALIDAMLMRAGGNHRGDRSAVDNFSDRELQVFRCIGQGMTTKEIASELQVGISTVDTYRERLKRKLQVVSSAELVHRATRWTLENSG
jgi:DNA-binding NarL/FixJ family response regulator